LLSRIFALAIFDGAGKALVEPKRSASFDSFQGELRSLDSSQKQAFMAPTENVSGQYWRFAKVGP
jgi:hypothetical protein